MLAFMFLEEDFSNIMYLFLSEKLKFQLQSE